MTCEYLSAAAFRVFITAPLTPECFFLEWSRRASRARPPIAPRHRGQNNRRRPLRSRNRLVAAVEISSIFFCHLKTAKTECDAQRPRRLLQAVFFLIINRLHTFSYGLPRELGKCDATRIYTRRVEGCITRNCRGSSYPRVCVNRNALYACIG